MHLPCAEVEMYTSGTLQPGCSFSFTHLWNMMHAFTTVNLVSLVQSSVFAVRVTWLCVCRRYVSDSILWC